MMLKIGQHDQKMLLSAAKTATIFSLITYPHYASLHYHFEKAHSSPYTLKHQASIFSFSRTWKHFGLGGKNRSFNLKLREKDLFPNLSSLMWVCSWFLAKSIQRLTLRHGFEI